MMRRVGVLVDNLVKKARSETRYGYETWDNPSLSHDEVNYIFSKNNEINGGAVNTTGQEKT